MYNKSPIVTNINEALLLKSKLICGALKLVDFDWIFTIGEFKAVRQLFGSPKVIIQLTSDTISSSYNTLKYKINTKKEYHPESEQYKYAIRIFSGKFYLDTIMTTSVYADSIIQHYNTVNNKAEENRSKFENKIIDLQSKYVENEEIKKLFFNFISDSPQEIFLANDYNLVFTDALLATHNYIGCEILKFDEDTFNKAKETLQNNDSLFTIIKEYIPNKFEMFLKILSVKLDVFDSDSITFLALSLLKQYCIEYYASLWENQYGNLFQNVNQITLDNCIDIYLNIDTLEQGNTQNVGKFTYYLMKKNKLDSNTNFLNCFDFLSTKVLQKLEIKRISDYAKKLETPKDKSAKYSIDDIDLMNGYEFEKFVSEMFSQMGYSTTVTKSSGDQGIDVIAEKNGNKIGIQAKCYSSTISNSAIQEAVAGLKYYGLNKAIVVTNNFFTNSAIELASANNVILWNRDMLKEKITQLF